MGDAVTDVLTREQRSDCMRAVKSRDTAPEMLVRRIAHKLGYRYALHSRDLPGNPDLVFVARRKAIFVHGCFWHNHTCARGARVPKTNREYWEAKRLRNEQRDRSNARKLRRDGWSVLTIWECRTKDVARLAKRIGAFLES
jgi:DNA mismatch endonuclease (patch repair protein)